MSTWWQGLAQRERFLVGVAAALTLLVIVWQFMLVPTLNARAAAKTDMQAASQRLNVLQEAYQAQRLGNIQAPQSTSLLTSEAFKAAITQSATEKGLSIARLQTGSDASVGIIFDGTDPRLVFFWLNDVEARLGGRIARLTMEQSGQGEVRVNVEIESPVS